MSSQRAQTDAAYDFLYGERYYHSVYPANNLHRTEQRPGIYAWFLRISPSLERDDNTNSKIASIFSSRTLKVNATGDLRERYKGTVYRSTPEIPEDGSYFMRSALAAFGSPLYIGISNNIQRRLLQHIEELDKRLQSYEGAYRDSADSKGEDSDGRDESRFFAHRMAGLLWSVDLATIDPLFVKVVYQDDDDPKCRKDAETLLNRLLSPAAGKR